MPNSHWPTLSRFSQISLIAVPTISTPATTWATTDQVRSVNARAGVPNSGLRDSNSVNTTGSAASAITTPAMIRAAVPRACEVSPINSGHRGNTKKK